MSVRVGAQRTESSITRVSHEFMKQGRLSSPGGPGNDVFEVGTPGARSSVSKGVNIGLKVGQCNHTPQNF